MFVLVSKQFVLILILNYFVQMLVVNNYLMHIKKLIHGAERQARGMTSQLAMPRCGAPGERDGFSAGGATVRSARRE